MIGGFSLDPTTVTLKQGGVAVPLAIEDTHALAGGVWFKPTAPLEPNTVYTLALSTYLVSFTTGSGGDAVAPTVDGPAIVGGALQGSCGANTVADVQLAALSDDLTPALSLFLRVDVTGGSGAGCSMTGGSAVGSVGLPAVLLLLVAARRRHRLRMLG